MRWSFYEIGVLITLMKTTPKNAASFSNILVFAWMTISWLGFSSFASPLFEIPLTTIDGTQSTLAPYQGRVILIVNTASQCGYTPQYEGLQKLYQKHKSKGFVVLGFPSNDFGGQEPGSNAKIKLFCEGTYHVDFPLFAKGPVSGSQRQPLYAFLLKESQDHSEVQWNFEKFLVGRDGRVIRRFRSGIEPQSEELDEALRLALQAGQAK